MGTPIGTVSPVGRRGRDLFQREFGSLPAHIVIAPGRVELLGNHTDYNEGLVLAAAVDRTMAFAVAPRTDGRIELVSEALPGRGQFYCNRLEEDSAPSWVKYVLGVLVQLRTRAVHFTGFSAAVASDIPPGAGLGSSAALMVATALAIRALHPYRLMGTGLGEPPARDRDGLLPPLSTAERLEVARVCLAAEEKTVGVLCGLLDPVSSLYGKAGQVIEFDCQSLAVERIPLAEEVALVLCPSGVTHTLADGQYNECRAACDSAARALGVRSLRSADARLLAANRSRLTAREQECAQHIVQENQRVVAATRALREGDVEQFGQYLYQSHASSRDLLRNSCAELDLLVELSRGHPACLGSRLTGGGFGGSTVHWVRQEGVNDFVQHMANAWEKRVAKKLMPQRCQIADGAS